jgi:hypothetical protein
MNVQKSECRKRIKKSAGVDNSQETVGGDEVEIYDMQKQQQL